MSEYHVMINYHSDTGGGWHAEDVEAESFGQAVEKIMKDFEYGDIWKLKITKNTI